jgi:hypothetical protein
MICVGKSFKQKKSLQEKHFDLLCIILWKKIGQLALKVATKLCQELSEALTPPGEDRVNAPPVSKRAHVTEELDKFLGTNVSSGTRAVIPERNRRATAQEMVDTEIKAYMGNTAIIFEDQVLDWWHSMEQHRRYLCLSKVASALFAQKPGSRGVLENDIGGLSDVISHRRGSMKAETAETIMMVKLNARIMSQYDPSDVIELGPKEWQNISLIARTIQRATLII